MTTMYKPKACFAALALALAGCAEAGVTTMRYGPSQSASAIQGFLGYAGSDGPILVRIHNNPFAPQPIDAAVTTEATRATSRPIAFTTDPGRAAQPDWRIVLVFNPPIQASARDACELAGAIAPQAGSSGVEAIGSFCVGPRLITGIRGTSGPINSANDPRFAQFVRRLIHDLFAVAEAPRPRN